MGNRVHICYGERQVLFNLQRLIILAKRKGNMERHYTALHSNKYDADFLPKSEFPKSSFKVINLIVKERRPFTEREFVKERFLEIAKKFLKDLKIRKGS
jgi:hypothetical protein